MRLALIAGCLSLMSCVFAQDATYPVFETDKIPIAQFKARREAIKAQLGPGGVAVLFTNPERNRNNDCNFRFRADSTFLYLTGFEEPDAALILAPDGFVINGQKVTELLFVNESDPFSITWLGYRMGSKEAKPLLGMEAVLPNSEFAATLKALETIPQLHFWLPSVPPDPSGQGKQMIEALSDWQAAHRNWPSPKGNIGPLVGRLRVKKSPEEIKLMKHAAEASALGHREVLKSVTPSMREYELMALVEYVFTRNGCESVGYNSIVGSGPNSCILHYEEDRRQIQNGDIICMDAAGEYHGYSADITRSFPANGKFSPAQREIYNIVLAAQEAGIAECRSGKQFGAAGQAAAKVVSDGLIKLGIMKSREELRTYLPHGVSHYVGLDVHDSQGDNILHPGYVLTVEPGIYIRAGSKCDPKYWNIGIRIEDDVLVTDKDPDVISDAAPKKIDEIEALMRKTGIGKRPVGQ